ncbi:MAG: tRNA (adenosine(37)-N6)-dimethylallyltransferase MiaA [Alphaproteobacteria bacterium]|nr:tRNA (adenosine(37)-N6)-dimethylallyltransferase MiaA [Alphaproteobacteria bacterium]
MHENPTLILVGGPTASGKSAFALELAQKRDGIIINADAMQIYAGLPVLTAQPDASARAAVPHLLYEILDAAQNGSAGKWLVLAQAAIAGVRGMGKTPIIVGGTGMYFAALLGGLADIPAIPEKTRLAAEKLYDEMGEEKFRREVAKKDSESAARIARNDRQRLIRAYAVAAHTGKSLSAWQKAGAARDPDAGYEKHLLLPPREELYAACDKRFALMMKSGAVEEVKALLTRKLSPSLPAMKILGLREIAAWLNGEITREEAMAKAQQMTRNYAKRQMTWFRNQWKIREAG